MMPSKYEQETIILFNEREALASVYTFNKALQEQLDALVKNQPARVQLHKSNSWGGKEYILPKSWVRIVPPRVLTEAQKRVLDDINQRKREKKAKQQLKE